MATIAVGVRELKNQAPELVQRASRGERIIITRYGRPSAVLGPVVDQAAKGQRPRMHAWQRERRAFERLSLRQQRQFAGRYVAVHRGRVVDSDGDHQRLFERVWRRLHGATFYVGRVGADATTIDMPGFALA